MAALKRGACLAAGLLAAAGAFAAGGHHAVDDAAILEPDQCELESWFTRAAPGERLLHAGVGCRVGPVELGLAAEYGRQGGGSQAGYGVSAKWAQVVAEGWSIGAAIGPAWQAHLRPRHQGTTVVALASWAPRDELALHLNLGRDLVRQGRDTARHGVAVEWLAGASWSLVAERYLEQRTHFARAGARWLLRKDWSVDLSRAQRLHGPGASAWTFGASWVFDRD